MGDHNILDAMSPRTLPVQSGPSRRLWWLLAPLLGLSLWVIGSQFRQTPVTRPPQVAVQQQPAAAVVVAPAPAPLARAEAVPAEAPVAVSAPASQAADPFNALAANTTVDSAPRQTEPKTLPATHTQVAVAKTSPEVSNTPAPLADREKSVPRSHPPANAPKLASKADPKTGASAATEKAPSRDPDVELLSAIMKHLGNSKTPPATGDTSASAQTIAELVKSCQTKDAIEALLCQRRICDGSWGKAQACPMSLAPQAAGKAASSR